MAAEAEKCEVDVTTIFDKPKQDGDKIYRYFNQPIEQIPGFDKQAAQVLVHRPSFGLQWVSLDQCLPVVTCLNLKEDRLSAERRKILVIKDFDADDCDIDITKCE